MNILDRNKEYIILQITIQSKGKKSTFLILGKILVFQDHA